MGICSKIYIIGMLMLLHYVSAFALVLSLFHVIDTSFFFFFCEGKCWEKKSYL